MTLPPAWAKSRSTSRSGSRSASLLPTSKVFEEPIATTLEPLEQFFEAEDYHQDFVARNPNQPYVAAVAMPKVKKLEKSFKDKLKVSR